MVIVVLQELLSMLLMCPYAMLTSLNVWLWF